MADSPTPKTGLPHYVSLAATLAAFIYVMVEYPELRNGRVVTFGTVGVFLTLYGVVFAIIETWRARSASELALQAATDANKRVVVLFNVKNISECQSCIRNALTDLDRDGWASTASLSRIVELYTAEFHEDYPDPESDKRLAIASLQSHAASASGPLKGPTLSRLKETLVKMLADLTAAAGAKLSEAPR